MSLKLGEMSGQGNLQILSGLKVVVFKTTRDYGREPLSTRRVVKRMPIIQRHR